MKVLLKMSALSKALVTWEKVFGRLQSVIVGVVHLHALPGTPKNSKTIQEIVDVACKETSIYFKHGVVRNSLASRAIRRASVKLEISTVPSFER